MVVEPQHREPKNSRSPGRSNRLEPDPPAAVQRYDTNGNGVIDRQEWLAAVDCHANHKLTTTDIQAAASARSQARR